MKMILAMLLSFVCLASVITGASEFGQVLHLSGQTFQLEGLKKTAIKGQDKLHYGQTILTKSESSLEIFIDEGNTVKVSENSSVVLGRKGVNKKKKGEILLQLNRGALRSSLKNLKKRSFVIKTPSLVAGVRGTDFIAQYDPETEDNAQLIAVLEGEVDTYQLKEDGEVDLLSLKKVSTTEEALFSKQGSFNSLSLMTPEKVKAYQKEFLFQAEALPKDSSQKGAEAEEGSQPPQKAKSEKSFEKSDFFV
ncbi:MAG: FecR domain-containing protein, partial [Planctomycetes bacterium]|nr:FecR domain-containing protein [Planctomycetota bacterium]